MAKPQGRPAGRPGTLQDAPSRFMVDMHVHFLENFAAHEPTQCQQVPGITAQTVRSPNRLLTRWHEQWGVILEQVKIFVSHPGGEFIKSVLTVHCMRLLARLLFALTLLQSQCLAATFTVTTTTDDDDGKPFDGAKPLSLRKAMRLASNAPGKDTIGFNIPTGGELATLVLNSELPPMIDPMVIDGYTQLGSKANSLTVGNNAILKVEIDCRNTVPTLSRGFYIRATGCEIRGLIINNCLEAGIIITRGFDTVIAGNWIGVQADGTTPSAGRKNKDGIWVSRSARNRIGGPSPADRNLISGNREVGLVIFGAEATNNQVLGNYICCDRTGGNAVPNQTGMFLFGSQNTIGDGTPGGRNIVSGNLEYGIQVSSRADPRTMGNVISGNYIGLGADGDTLVPNQYDGILLWDAEENTIGGTTAAAGNVISGNIKSGISLYVSSSDPATTSTSNNQIYRNLIGTDATGTKPRGNGVGIVFGGGPVGQMKANKVGAVLGGARLGNVISGNTGAGVLIANGSFNTIQGNLIGVDVLGKVPLGNKHYGVRINAVLPAQLATTNLIGGLVAGAGNVIAGNSLGGVLIEGTNAIGNIVQGNFIGTDSTGLTKLGNLGSGIEILGAKQSVIGAAVSTVPTDQHANRVAYNLTFGVKVSGDTASGNTIRGNRTHDNGNLAIVLGDNASSTPPDPLPPDTGPNGWAQAPSQLSVRHDAQNEITSISGRITGPNPDQVTIDLYAEPADSKKPFGDQSTFLTSAKPDTFGYFCALTAGNVGGPGSAQRVAATATSASGSTSRFASPRFKLVALEVNQSVQDWMNSVTLFARKTTYVRAFLESMDGADYTVPWSELDSQLLVRKDGVDVVLKPEFPAEMQILGDASKGRKNRQGSINFRIPESSCDDTLQLLFQTEGILGVLPGSFHSSADCLPCGVQVTFARPPRFEITLVNVTYRLLDPSTDSWMRYYNDPDEILYNKLLIEHMLPVVSIDWKEKDLDLGGIPNGVAPYPGEPLNKVYKTAGSSTRSFLALIPGDPFRGRVGKVTAGLGSRVQPYVAAAYHSVPYGELRAIPAHELVHTLGFDHALTSLTTPVLDSSGNPLPDQFEGPCGEQTMGPPPAVAFPYSNDQHRPTLGPLGPSVKREDIIFGFDTTPPAVSVINPEKVKELMCYCTDPTLSLWISGVTYEKIAKILETRFGLASATDRDEHRKHLRLQAQVPARLLVRGTVNHVAGTVDFTPFSLTDDPAHLPAASGKCLLQLLDETGRIIYSTSFRPEPSLPGSGPLKTGSFILDAPASPEYRRAEVLRDGAVLASRNRSRNAPVVSNLSPAGGENIQTPDLLIQWAGTDQDGDSLSYDVQLSTDGGVSWSTLVADWTETSFTVPVANLEGTRLAKVRVIASDGFNVTSLQSPGSFTLPNQPPTIRILSPRQNQSVYRSQNFSLQAFASDLQDGRLTASNVTWHSSLDGLLGAGAVLDLDVALLTVGVHQITATASNSVGQASSETRVLAVEQSLPENSINLGVTAQPVPAAPLSGLTASLVVSVANLGISTANDVRLEVSLPPSLPNPTSPVTNASITLSGHRLAADLGQLFPGQSTTLTLSWTNVPAGNHRIESSVSAREADLNPDDNHALSGLLVTPAVPELPNLILSLTSTPENPGPDDTLNYVVSIVNQGTAAATQVRMTNVLDQAASLTSAGVSQGSWTTHGNQIVSDFGTVPVGGEGYLYFSVQPSVPGPLYYRISAIANETDLEPLDNLTSKIVTVTSQLRLSVATAGGQIRLEWPNHPNLQLQQTDRLGQNAAWSTVPDSPVLQGDRWVYVAPVSGSTRFYRLIQQ